MTKPDGPSGQPGALQPPPVTPRAGSAEAPLSFLQERFWLEQRFSPEEATHNVPVFFRLRGELDRAALAGAVENVLRRHQVLRSRIAEVEGQPRVRIESFEALQLEEADLSAVEHAGEQTQALLLRLLDAPFDLARAPLLRAGLYRLAGEQWVLALVFHQSVFDSLSDPVLRRELAADYAALKEGRPSPVPAPPLQYADFAAWQRRELAGRLDAAAEAWRHRLAGLSEPLSWPPDRRRLLSPSRRGAQILTAMPAAQHELLVRRAAELGCAEETLVLAALAALLARVGQHSFVTVGLPVALRPPELEPLIGNFDNLVVLAVRLPGDPSFRQIAGQVAAEEEAARAAGFFPYEQLVEALRPERAPESGPFFRVFFHRQPAAHRHIRLDRLEIGRLSPPVRRSRHDLELTLVDGGSRGMAFSFAYSVDLYDRPTAERFAESFLTLLGGALEDPGRRLSELPLMPPAILRALEGAARGRFALWPRQESLAEIFAHWTAARRDELALVYGRERRTYGELERISGGVAGELAARGVAPGAAVGLCGPRSADLVAACLGILRAGAVVAPLDPEDPPMRLRRMLDKSGAETVIAHPAVAYRLETWPGELLLLDQLLAAAAARPAADPLELPAAPPPLAGGESGAMLLFTSGSTGEPKGVLLAHRNLMRLIAAVEELDLPPGLTFGQLSSFTFDAVAFEMWGAFAGGGRLVGIERATAANAAALRAQLERDGIEVLLVTSAAFHQLARQNPRVFAGLPLLIFGGERADPEVVRQVLREGPPVRLVHAYGPTEATTFATLHEIRHLAEDLPVPIGRPLAETRAMVLDRLGRPAPVGVPGELYLGGPALALGYHGEPAATAAVFLPDPGGAPGERLYKSGDLARWSHKLELEFVGRADQQVKIDGARIELGEIEAALGGHPAVAQKVVVVQHDAAGKPHLIAFVVPPPAARPASGGELRSFLRQQLPEFMVPSAVLLLGILPQTPHGKVDRRSLPHFTLLDYPDEAEPGPRDEVEIVLERLWCEVMGADHVAMEDNFFDLGGHSLLATQVLAKLRTAFGVDLPLREVFRAPTIARMAELVRAARSGGHHLAAPPLHRWPEPHPLSAQQERRYRALVAAGAAAGPGSAEECSTQAAELGGQLDEPQLLRALKEVARRHEALRSRVHVRDDAALSWTVAEDLELPLARADLRGFGEGVEEELARLLAAEASRPFQPRDFFWRCLLIELSPTRRVLAITVHRLLFDAASERLLWGSLAVRYAAGKRNLDAGAAAGAADRPVGPGDWSAHRRHWLVGETREAMLRPWRALLEKSPRLSGGPYRTEVLRLELPLTVARAIRGLAQRHHCPPTAVALAAWCALLAREQPAEPSTLLVASSLDGRHYPELERILGSFESKIILRIDLKNSGFPALLREVQDAQRFALEHRDLSFAELVLELAPDADPRQDPFCSTAFRWLAGQLPHFDQLATRYLPQHSGWSVHPRELCIVELPEHWRAELTHPGDAATADRWLRDWVAILLRAAEK
jgi:amino acid adenylation domain-containing protein